MGRGTIRVLVIASVAMGVLIVVGVAVLATLVVRRTTGWAGGMATAVSLREPAGTRIAAASGTAETLVLTLQGGGPDRVLVVSGATGRVVRRLELVP